LAISSTWTANAAAQRKALPANVGSTSAGNTRGAVTEEPQGRTDFGRPVPVRTNCLRDHDLTCRITEASALGPLPPVSALRGALEEQSKKEGGKPLVAVLCPCDGGSKCLGVWGQKLPSNYDFVSVDIKESAPAVGYLLSGSKLEFRIRWSTSLDGSGINSEGILSYHDPKDGRPTPKGICEGGH